MHPVGLVTGYQQHYQHGSSGPYRTLGFLVRHFAAKGNVIRGRAGHRSPQDPFQRLLVRLATVWIQGRTM